MPTNTRRRFLTLATQTAAAALSVSAFPPSIQKALAVPAARRTGTIRDVRHIVILMQENRSFDHYFGTLRGVRGFGDRHPIPLASGKPTWFQSDGQKEIPPFHFDTRTTSAIRAPVTPHSFSDAQAAWSQGRFGHWPKYKTADSMGYYRREDIPFQFALAEAFTLCDAYHCSITTGTDPNRIVFWSGANANPELTARGVNSTAADSEPNNLRCWIEGRHPVPGYTYAGSAFKWPTIPDVLQKAGVSWRIYQDPNDNWTGAMHGCLAFESFRTAKPGSPIFENGMSHWSLEHLAEDVKQGRLPQVSWILPPAVWSEHPRPSSPLQGAEFISRVLDALTANPEVWSQTVFFHTFDENDGLFDHVPPPAPPSYNADGTVAGKSTLNLNGEYFSDPERSFLHKDDTISGTLRPWGMGPRVPMYIVSPWSKGGWVNSQVFDHTSVGQFIEKRFGVTIPAISAWHRAVSGDLTSAFDFANPGEAGFPAVPRVKDSVAVVAEHSTRPKPAAPAVPEPLFQEPGTRPSRALPYKLDVVATPSRSNEALQLTFINDGRQGAVFHVYDKLNLERIPRRYTVEANKQLRDEWPISAASGYSLWICGPNGFVRELKAAPVRDGMRVHPVIDVRHNATKRTLTITIRNTADAELALILRANAYRTDPPETLTIGPQESKRRQWSVSESGNWYDFTIASPDDVSFTHRFAGRLETGHHTISDPALAI